MTAPRQVKCEFPKCENTGAFGTYYGTEKLCNIHKRLKRIFPEQFRLKLMH